MLKSSSKSSPKFRFQSRRRKPLKDGWCFPRFEARFFIIGALSVVFYFIAGNTGSGWIYLLSASLMAGLIMGLIMPIFQVAGIRVAAEAPTQAVAGEKASLILRATPHSPLLPIRWFRLASELDSPKSPTGASPYLAIEALDQELTLPWTTDALPRGVHPLGTTMVSSCFPIGLVWWRRRSGAGAGAGAGGKTITVYPKTASIDGLFLYKLQPSMAAAGGPSRGRQSARQSTSTRGIREYVRGDSPRIVHWASTARTGKLLVREFETEGLPRFDVLLDLAADWQSQDQFELAVTAASSLLSLGVRLGIGPQLLLNPDLSDLDLDIPPTPPGIELQMEILARVNPVSPTAAGQSLPEPKGENVLIVVRPECDQRPYSAACYLVEIAADLDKTLEMDGPKAGPAARESGILRSLVAREEDLAEL